MNENYSTPFYVGRNSRFKGVSSNGFLPALEGDNTEENPPPIKPEPEWAARQWDIVNQVKAEVIHWRKQHAEALLEIDKMRELLQPSKKDKQQSSSKTPRFKGAV